MEDYSKIEVILTDVLDYEIIKFYNKDGILIKTNETERSHGIMFVINDILPHCKCKPEVWVHDVKVRILKHKLEL